MRAEPTGVPSHFQHPAPPASDGLGRLLGRVRNARLDGDKVRADLHFDSTAFETPPMGGRALADYVLALAASDQSAAGASLVLQSDKIVERDARGRALLGSDGQPLPPIWRPLFVAACDVVSVGDATRSMLGCSLFRSIGETADPAQRCARWRDKLRREEIPALPSAALLAAASPPPITNIATGRLTMRHGTITRLGAGFGFLAPDGGRRDLYFHCLELIDVPFDERLIGMRVSYTIARPRRGPRATCVTPLPAGAIHATQSGA